MVDFIIRKYNYSLSSYIFFYLCPPTLYCRSVRWAGPLICVQRSGQSGQLSPAPALAPAPSVRGEGGQTGPVRGGGSDRHRALSRGERAHGAGSMAPLYPHTPAPTVGRTGHWPGCTGTLDTRHPPSPGHLTPEPELPELIMIHSESAGAGG